MGKSTTRRIALSARRQWRWIACGVVVSLFVTFVALTVVAATRDNQPAGVAVTPAASSALHLGDVAPTNFRLARLGGGSLVDFQTSIKGRPAVINLFASWCAACAAELRAFARVSSTFHNKVSFIGVDTNDTDPSAALHLLRAAGADYPVGIDTSSLAVATRYGASALPVTFFVRANGRIAQEVLGKQDVASLTSRVKALLRTS